MSSSSSTLSNGGVNAGNRSSGAAPGRVASVYTEVQTSRLNYVLPLPSVLKNPFKIVDGPKSSAAGNPDEIAKLFPNLFGQPSALLVPSDTDMLGSNQKLKIGVVLSGGQAPGGHNIICGIFDYLQERAKGSTLYGFKGGPAGIMKCKYVELTSDFIYPYRNQGGFDMICSGRDKIETPEQFKQAEETSIKLDLDGLVVIGGDDSNTNACLLAENFRGKNIKTRVIGCPKTIDGDLKCKEVPTSFGFDTACKIYAEMIGNVMTDARSTGKYYHFVRLMGRAASHITLECALQTHPNITIIGEEVAAKKQTLKNVTDYITDVICKRSKLGYNYGVILIPEGLIDFIPEVQQLIAELNEILAHGVVDEGGLWKKKLRDQSQLLFEFLPPAIQEQLMLERDPHGNVQVVAKIETEKMLIQMVETELEKRRHEGAYDGEFKGQSHFFGYEGRCGFPTNFDSTYCYALGYAAGALLHSGKTGLISSVANLGAPVEEWTVGGTALTALMDVERRHGKFKPVIKKAMVELEGAPFRKFASMRDEWAFKNRYISPGMLCIPYYDVTLLNLMHSQAQFSFTAQQPTMSTTLYYWSLEPKHRDLILIKKMLLTRRITSAACSCNRSKIHSYTVLLRSPMSEAERGRSSLGGGGLKKKKTVTANELVGILGVVMFLVRRLIARNPTANLRCYCTPPSSSSSSSSPHNNKLFVGGLSWAVDEKSLKEAFSSFGDVTEVRIMYDKDSGRSRGFGFVYFSQENDARSAKDAMDGKAFLGRPLRINFALEKVRGGPVVVPRLSNITDVSSRNN
ncbi:Phosphofructokinase domain [Macleaya cordata]|uniref:Pyrophosphate--fructose 6-phosphate 1-phosphotransferase subunit beta n=1 Tax=Macleaya cordata TaxID=56857 RepID=A0A200PYX8_MACCD|nr:Phosphofructokinase domain [Macleaya cordata]